MYYGTDPCSLCYKNILTIISDDCKWCRYAKCVMALALVRILSYTPRVVLKITASFKDDCSGAFLMFIVQPARVKSHGIFFHFLLQKKFVIASSTKNIIEKLS